jgi:dihydroceramide fatty acyl 2-hydroxylase
MHYLLHGCHHKHPMDGLRLVFPPAATAILLVPVCVLWLYNVI